MLPFLRSSSNSNLLLTITVLPNDTELPFFSVVSSSTTTTVSSGTVPCIVSNGTVSVAAPSSKTAVLNVSYPIDYGHVNDDEWEHLTSIWEFIITNGI